MDQLYTIANHVCQDFISTSQFVSTHVQLVHTRLPLSHFQPLIFKQTWLKMSNFNKISVKAIHAYTTHQIILTKLMDGCLTLL